MFQGSGGIVTLLVILVVICVILWVLAKNVK